MIIKVFSQSCFGYAPVLWGIQKWVTDISYIHTKQGVLYLSVIRDLYDRSIVAYKTGTDQTVNLVLDTIRLAVRKEKLCKKKFTDWNCKYHIVFVPKYRRKIFYGEHKAEIGKILRELCEWKGVNIIEAEVCPDPHSRACRNTAERECFGLYGIPERKEQYFDMGGLA